MCTLALGFQLDRRWPVIVAANRDEQLDRPSEGWALRTPRAAQGSPAAPPWTGPLDLQAGGTWVGISAAGVFAGVTNHFVRLGWAPDPTRRSRGELVPLALAAPSAASAAAALAKLDAAAWNPFHLVIADARQAFVWWWDGESSSLAPLDPGLHVVTERDPEGRGPRAERLRARWPSDPSPARLRELLIHHGAEGLEGAGIEKLLRTFATSEATCVHGDPAYGTRSSVLLRLAPDLAASELYVAEARPCLAPHEDRSELLVALGRRAG
jgi:uncharacterized protein with NRDE domain